MGKFKKNTTPPIGAKAASTPFLTVENRAVFKAKIKEIKSLQNMIVVKVWQSLTEQRSMKGPAQKRMLEQRFPEAYEHFVSRNMVDATINIDICKATTATASSPINGDQIARCDSSNSSDEILIPSRSNTN